MNFFYWLALHLRTVFSFQASFVFQLVALTGNGEKYTTPLNGMQALFQLFIKKLLRWYNSSIEVGSTRYSYYIESIVLPMYRGGFSNDTKRINARRKEED